MTTSETKWTPGPWFAHRSMPGYGTGICISRRPAAEAATVAGDCPVAIVHEGAPQWETKYPAQANARLIAAAPALYAALEALLGDLFFEGADDLYCEVCERPAPTDSDGTVIGRVHHADGCAYAAARAALSSARGEGA